MASDPPLFDDELEGAWRTRFVMPAGRTSENLPDAPEGIELVDLPPRTRRGGELSRAAPTTRCWPSRRIACAAGWRATARKPAAEPEYAFYNSPMIPGPLRRNEVWLPLS